MTPSLVLLGDSVIDNAAYVRPGEPDVPAQVRARAAGWRVDCRALDGSTTGDVIAHQLAAPVPEGAAVFLSVGGNDALMSIDLLADPTPTTFGAAMERLDAVRNAFRQRYATLVDAIASASGRVMAATIYHPAFDGSERALQAAAEGALAGFNDVIQREALRAGFRVLELRTLFDSLDDYANPIEPSAIGGAKIARAIAAWLA